MIDREMYRRNTLLADAGKPFPRKARRGGDPEPAPYTPIDPNDPASGGVARTKGGKKSYGYLPLGQSAPDTNIWTPPQPKIVNTPGLDRAANATVGQIPGWLGQAPAPDQIARAKARTAALDAGKPDPGMGGQALNRPTNQAPAWGSNYAPSVPASLAPSASPSAASAPAAQAQATPDRIRAERDVQIRNYREVMRQLESLGAMGRDTPEMAQRRDMLIQMRHGIEQRLRTMSAAVGGGPTVNPEQAKVARERLALTSGVDTRTPTERGMTSIANRTMPGAGRVLGEAVAMNEDKAAYARRQDARIARQSQAVSDLTTALPGGRSTLDELERERMLVKTRELDSDALNRAVQDRTLRDLREGTPQEQLAKSQARTAESMSELERARANRLTRQIENPNSAENRMDSAQSAVAGRSSAQAISGYTPDSIRSGAMQTITNLPKSLSITTDPVQYGSDVDAFIANVVVPLEELARSGDAVGASQVASEVVGNPSLRPYRSLMDRLGGVIGTSVNTANLGQPDQTRAVQDLFDSRSAQVPEQLRPHVQKLTEALARLRGLATKTPSR